MAYFSIGEVVTVRSDLSPSQTYGLDSFATGMLPFLGKRVRIVRILGRGYAIEGTYFTFTDQMFVEYRGEAKKEEPINKMQQLEDRIQKLEQESAKPSFSGINRKVVNLSQSEDEMIINIIGKDKYQELKNAGFEIKKIH